MFSRSLLLIRNKRKSALIICGCILIASTGSTVYLEWKQTARIWIVLQWSSSYVSESGNSNRTGEPTSSSSATTATHNENERLIIVSNQTTQTIGGGVIQRHGILDLLPWELQSIHEYHNVTNATEIKIIGQCHPPPGIYDSCCPGSFSTGGSVDRSWAHVCFRGADMYNRVSQTVLQVLQRTDAMVDDEECDICRIVEIIYQHNLRFAVTGDSMMSQNMDGFFCELLRRGYNVSQVNTEMVTPFHAMFGVKEIWTHEISGPKHWQFPIQIQFFFQYRPNANNMTEMQDIVTSYDVLMMNFGLHWRYQTANGLGRNKEHYENTMGKLFNVTRQGNITLLAHRETSAQHHNYTGGEWATTRTACVPLNYHNDSEIIGWREEVVQSKAKELGYKVVIADETLGDNKVEENELVVLPFFNLTASMYYLHPDECTHYCSTPYLWMPIWRSLRLAMDRQWSNA